MSNTGITLVDVRQEAMDTIKQLKNKTIDVSTAKEIRGLLDVVVNTAKVQVDFMNALPKHIKDKMPEDKILAIAATLRDRDAEMDETMNDIEKRRSEPYKTGE